MGSIGVGVHISNYSQTQLSPIRCLQQLENERRAQGTKSLFDLNLSELASCEASWCFHIYQLNFQGILSLDDQPNLFDLKVGPGKSYLSQMNLW